MATMVYAGRNGGKFRKRPLRRVPFIPYCRLPPATEAGGSGWLSKLVGPAARVIVRSASRLFSFVSGKNFKTVEEVPEVKSSLEVREQGGNPIDGSDRFEQKLISGTYAIFKFERLLKQERFSRAEAERLTELVHSRIIEPSTSPLADYKNKIPEEGFGSPIEIARAYMGYKPLKEAPSTLGSQSIIYHSDSRNDLMTPKPRGRSALYNLSRSLNCRSSMMTNPWEYTPYNDSNVKPTRSLEWTPSRSNIRHSGRGKALERGSPDSDARCFGDARRVRQKSCLKDLNLSTYAYTSSTSFFGQEYRQDIDLKGQENLDDRIPSASIFYVPPRSTVLARKISHQLDKVQLSPRNKSFEKKVIVGDASFSKSSLSAFHEGSLKIKGNNDSTKLVTVQSSRILKDPSSSTSARITSSASPNQDKAKEKASPMPSISGAEVASSCLGKDSYVTYALDGNHNMRSMDSEFAFLSTQKEQTVQSATHDEVESTKAEHAILAFVKEPREKSVVHSLEDAPTSGLIHA